MIAPQKPMSSVFFRSLPALAVVGASHRPTISPGFVIDRRDGRFRVEHHPLLQALEGIEVSRIRECAICHQIFWAQRADQPCCTRRCAHILRTRRWRKRYPKKYKIQRYRRANAKGHTDERLEQERVEVLQDDIS